ncbi:MAG: hypothetical protein WCJ24_00435 [Candidatus Saccharibacteria bacterium]
MVIWLSLRWWYGAGWQWATNRAVVERLQWCNETFSITALIKTWLAPFKQTYSKPGGPIDVRIHVFFDNVISRFVGFFARSFIILTGALASLAVLISGMFFVALWPLAPFALPVSLLMMIFGVGR